MNRQKMPSGPHRLGTASCILVCAIVIAGARSGQADEPFSAPRLMAHVRYLASPELRGRQAGTADERHAAEYIAGQLNAAGVGTLPGHARFQPFDLPYRSGPTAPKSLNVLGWIAGSDPQLSPEIVVLGAHVDHLGVRDGKLYTGADDNASGVAVVLEIAARLASGTRRPKRTVLVAFFGSEEVGLLGSRAFVQHCPVDRSRIVAMINIDMIGRPLLDQADFAALKSLLGIDAKRSVGVLGATASPFFGQTVDAAGREANLQIWGTRKIPILSGAIDNLAKNRSDHSPFDEVGIPTLFFGSGESNDYHQPGDTADKIDGDLLAQRALVVFSTVAALAAAPRDKIPPVRKVAPRAADVAR